MVFGTIKNALMKELDLAPDIITESAMVRKDLELDSTENVIISLELKKKYGIDYIFPKNDISLGEICKMVTSLLNEKAKEPV